MTLFPILSLLLAMQSQSGEQVVRRVIVRDELILKIPVRPRPSQRIEWSEHKGPKCVAADRIAGASLSGPSTIDFILRDRRRVRAVMDDECPALDFYQGFYLRPEDDRICAKRETIQNRVGASCRIQKFRLLVPQLKQVRR